MARRKMTFYWFKHYQSGRAVDILLIKDITMSNAVSRLSDKYKGVFKLFAKVRIKNEE